MLIFTACSDGLRVAVDLASIVTVGEYDGYCLIQCRLSPAIQTTDGLWRIKVKESFSEVMVAILDYRDDNRWRTEQRARLL